MSDLPYIAASQGRRLLRVLLLWHGTMPADPAKPLLLRERGLIAYAAIGAALPALGEEVHTLVLGESDAALVGNGLGQHGAQVGAFESQ